MSRKTWKQCFLTLFAERRAKSSKNAVFFAFFAKFVQSVSKNVKKLFSHDFCWALRKNLKKRCFFRIFCELRTKCLEKREKTLFPHTFGKRRAKRSKNAVFCIFCETLNKVSRNTWKKHCFLTLLENVVQKGQKKLFFIFFGKLWTVCLRKRENTLFSHTFWETSRKKLKKTPFFANFVQSVSKNVKKHCILTLFGERRAKSSKNAVFRIFCELCSKCLEKREKTLYFHNFC